jgi:hypothetical protein
MQDNADGGDWDPLTQIRTEKLQMNVIYKEFHVTGGALRRA